jgi:hypothetical protein
VFEASPDACIATAGFMDEVDGADVPRRKDETALDEYEKVRI